MNEIDLLCAAGDFFKAIKLAEKTPTADRMRCLRKIRDKILETPKGSSRDLALGKLFPAFGNEANTDALALLPHIENRKMAATLMGVLGRVVDRQREAIQVGDSNSSGD